MLRVGTKLSRESIDPPRLSGSTHRKPRRMTLRWLVLVPLATGGSTHANGQHRTSGIQRRPVDFPKEWSRPEERAFLPRKAGARSTGHTKEPERPTSSWSKSAACLLLDWFRRMLLFRSGTCPSPRHASFRSTPVRISLRIAALAQDNIPGYPGRSHSGTRFLACGGEDN